MLVSAIVKKRRLFEKLFRGLLRGPSSLSAALAFLKFRSIRFNDAEGRNTIYEYEKGYLPKLTYRRMRKHTGNFQCRTSVNILEQAKFFSIKQGREIIFNKFRCHHA